MVMEPPSPMHVGREFVRQYYTLLNQAPLHLHRFYSHNSSFVHGGLENNEPVFGQQEIHQKIMTLNFRDCHAKIRQVDSHETLANGVVVQVSGELSNNGEPMRRFMQTFVLAPQSPKKYYVHNDIFRYQDEVFDETADSNVSHVSGSSEMDHIREMKESQVAVVMQEQAKEPAPSQQPPPHTNGGSNNHEVGGGGGGPQPQVEPMAVEEAPVSEWREPAAAVSAPAPAFSEQTAAPAPQPQHWKSPEPAPAPAQEVTQVEDSAVEAADGGEAGGEAEAAAAASSDSSAPRSWSSLVKSGGGAPGKPPVAPQQGQAPPTQARESVAKEGTPFSVGGGSQAGGPGPIKPGGPPGGLGGLGGPPAGPGGYQRAQRGSSQGRSPGQPGPRPDRFSKEEMEMVKNEDSQQLFVGNLPHNCSNEDLVELFSKYGKVVDVRINQKQGRESAARGRDGKPGFVPNFGFIVFTDSESVERALAAKPILLYGSHRLNVEEKKMRAGGERGPHPATFGDRDQKDYGKRGSQDNLRGAGHPGGRGGGDRGRGGGRGGPRGGGRGDFSGHRGGDRGRGGYRGGRGGQ